MKPDLLTDSRTCDATALSQQLNLLMHSITHWYKYDTCLKGRYHTSYNRVVYTQRTTSKLSCIRMHMQYATQTY